MTTQATAFAKTAKVITKYGHDVTLTFASEDAHVSRDKYGTVIGHDAANTKEVTLKSFPIRYSPVDKDMQQAGMTQECDVIIWTAKNHWSALNYSFEQIRSADMRFVVDGQSFRAIQKQRVGQFGTDWRYITISGAKLDGHD